MQIARKVASGIEYTQRQRFLSVYDNQKLDRCQEFLYKLMDEFKPELMRLGVSQLDTGEPFNKNIHFKLADPIKTEKVYTRLEEDEQVLLENKNGWKLKDGLNLRTKIRGWVEIGDMLALSIEPAMRASEDEMDLDLEEICFKVGIGNLEMGFGRDTLWWGPGYHGSMLLSNNAYPLPMLKLSNQRPYKLPWLLKEMGDWNSVFFISRLEEKRVISEPYLVGMRTEYNPFSYFTFGMSRTIILGGEGRPHLSLSDYVRIFRAAGRTEFKEGKLNTDQLAAFDFTLRLPRSQQEFFKWLSNIELYWEYAGEDRFAPWENEAPGYLLGIYTPDLFRFNGLDFRAEYAKTGSSWYTHGTYGTGYRYKGSILGHHMATDAQDIFLMLSKDFENNIKANFTLDVERQGVSLSNVQRKLELGINFALAPFEDKDLNIEAGYELEHFDNYENVANKKVKNHILEFATHLKF